MGGPKVGTVVTVPNKNRPRFTRASTAYKYTRLQEKGEEFPVLITACEMAKIRARAARNPEDCEKPSWWTDVRD